MRAHVTSSCVEVVYVIHASGRVDMLTSPVAAARAAVATGAWVILKHDLYLIRASGSLSFVFTHPPEGVQYLRTVGHAQT